MGERLFDLMEDRPVPGFWSQKGAYARIMEWSMKDPAFKTQLFRFVDVLPALRSPQEVVRHLKEYLGDKAVELNPAFKAGLAASGLAPALVAAPIKANVAAMARQFVAGEDPGDLIRRLRENRAAGIATTIDLLGEAVLTEAEADAFLKRNLDVLDAVSAALAGHRDGCFSEVGGRGPEPPLNLSVKISALAPALQPADTEGSLAALGLRLRPILDKAKACGAFVAFDMESRGLKDLTLQLFRSVMEEPAYRELPASGIAIQAYLRDSERDLRSLIAWARQNRRRITVRLVKGAYWDYETILAGQRGWPPPVWARKPESDAHFEKLSVILLENEDAVTPAFATHNVRSCAHAIAQAERLGVGPAAYEFQALYGMADELKAALRNSGHRVREYCPIGELLPGMAYLVRRLLENTSNEGFLRARRTGEATRVELLRDPREALQGGEGSPAPACLREETFRNAPNADFSRPEPREAMRAALAAWAGRLGRSYPLVIAGRRIGGRELVASVNPAHPNQIVGAWARATSEDADRAVEAARSAFPGWSETPVEQRAGVLERAASLMEARRFELGALEILEAGKPWAEADADVSEAIDFCRFYAAEMRRMGAPRTTQRVPGERCVEHRIARGTGASIAPWNFPLAILTGLTVAPLVAGNTLVMKPAEQTAVIGAQLAAILAEAGLPDGVLQFLPGYGEDVGARLAAHPGVDFVAFTGSRAVGLRIWEEAGRTRPGQPNLKTAVCEMGGKNALIVDDDADLDEAIPAILQSAFGFAGQKCSALSRLVVLRDIHDELVGRLVAAAAALRVGDPAHPGTVIGPLIDAEARDRVLGHIARGREEATLAWQGTAPLEGYFVPPTIFTNVKPGAAVAREEIFGPVLAVMAARDLDEAIAIANATEYALTGGLFSRSPGALRRAERELRVGNVYLNRGITGAVVERHPFGGFKMSGGGTKAGGPGYLENFLFSKVVAENILRRGFSPAEQ